MDLDTLTDKQLVLEIGRGCMPALGELVRRWQKQALHVAYRSLGDWQLAEDVVQEGFLRVHRASPRYKPDAQFSTWFYRIIVNLCLDSLRKHQRRRAMAAELAEPIPQSSDNPLHQQEVVEMRQAVRKAIQRLDERERIVVILHRFEGLSHRHIAEIIENSQSAVESLLVRAYRKLRKELAVFSENKTKKTQDQANLNV